MDEGKPIFSEHLFHRDPLTDRFSSFYSIESEGTPQAQALSGSLKENSEE